MRLYKCFDAQLEEEEDKMVKSTTVQSSMEMDSSEAAELMFYAQFNVDQDFFMSV